MTAQAIVLAGPSGSGKSRLAERLGLPVLRLDDFYKDGGDPTLPSLEIAGGAPIVDWDHPDSWNAADAVAVIETLCQVGSADLPVYDIATSARTGSHRLDVRGQPLFVAEGVFAQEIVRELRERGLLADAICVSQRPIITFWRRFARDLQERRKPPLVLLRRGLHLLRSQRQLVARAEVLGCRTMTPSEAYAAITRRAR